MGDPHMEYVNNVIEKYLSDHSDPPIIEIQGICFQKSENKYRDWYKFNSYKTSRTRKRYKATGRKKKEGGHHEWWP